MNQAPFWHTLPRKAIDWIWLIGGVIGAFFLGNFIATSGVWNIVVMALMVFAVAWVFFARQAWWVVLPFFVFFSGIIYVGFKVYFYELALFLSLLAFLPGFALKQPLRRKLPLPAWLLMAYLVLHWGTSVWSNRTSGLGGTGNITRVYLQAIWPLIFMVPFYCFGVATRFQKTVLLLLYIGVILRIVVALISQYFPQGIAFLPTATFVLSGPLSGVGDLRSSGLLLVLLTMCYFHIVRPILFKAFHLMMLVIAFGLVLLGGGRVSVGMLFLIMPLWAFLYRKFFLGTAITIALVAVVVVLNANANLIYEFPDQMQRALSVLVAKKANIDWHGRLEGSDIWHQRLAEIAYERWTDSVPSFFLGHQIVGFDDAYLGNWTSMELRAQIAANMATYESGLWTVLSGIGVVGMFAYALLFTFLLKDVAVELVKERIRNYRHAFSFLALFMLILWIGFSWIAGGFPSQEFLLAVIAKVMYEESRPLPSVPTTAPR